MISKFRIKLKKRSIKALEKISEPYYSNVKEAIFSLAENPREKEKEKEIEKEKEKEKEVF